MNMGFQPRPVPKPCSHWPEATWSPQNAGCSDQRCPLPGWCKLHSGTTRQLGGSSPRSPAMWPGSQVQGLKNSRRSGIIAWTVAWGGGLEDIRVSGSPAWKHPECPRGQGRAVDRSLTKGPSIRLLQSTPGSHIHSLHAFSSDFLITDYVSLLQLLPAA